MSTSIFGLSGGSGEKGSARAAAPGNDTRDSSRTVAIEHAGVGDGGAERYGAESGDIADGRRILYEEGAGFGTVIPRLDHLSTRGEREAEKRRSRKETREGGDLRRYEVAVECEKHHKQLAEACLGPRKQQVGPNGRLTF
jgi:hypothetical protein